MLHDTAEKKNPKDVGDRTPPPTVETKEDSSCSLPKVLACDLSLFSNGREFKIQSLSSGKNVFLYYFPNSHRDKEFNQ